MAENLSAKFSKFSIGAEHADAEDVNMTGSIGSDVAGRLLSREQAQLLDLISELRALGVGDHVELPQLIVVGDQSSGKSSVLEAISGFHFPTKEGLCTTFATEINLRPAGTACAMVTIEPHSSRSSEQKKYFQAFRTSRSQISDLPEIISNARDYMAHTPNQAQSGVFAKDVLKVTVSQPNAPPLTLVDLPGIIKTESGKQTAEDVETVEKLVCEYMQNEGSIILAVVNASNDAANQIVLSWARKFDQQKSRTLGIITKPDLTYSGSESQAKVMTLAKNQEESLVFDLGWHVVRNRDFTSREVSMQERDATERHFFQQQPWSSLPRGHVGVEALRERLQKILCKNVRSALPQILKDLAQRIAAHEAELSQLGDGRPSVSDKRKYLSTVAERFQGLLREGINGLYRRSFCNTAEGHPQYRLRAAIASHNGDFAQAMAKMGHARVHKDSQMVTWSPEPNNRYMKALPDPELVNWPALRRIATAILDANKQGLPDIFDSDAIGDLFANTAQPWRRIADTHVHEVWALCKDFLEAVVDASADPACANALKMECIEPAMQRIHQMVDAKVTEVINPFVSNRPLTSNPNYGTQSNSATSTPWSSPQEYEEPADTPEKMIFKRMWAYYQVSIWTFVDNVNALVVQSTLVDNLAGVFSPIEVLSMEDDMVELLAAEPADQQRRRQILKTELQRMKEGLKRCRSEAVVGSRSATSHQAAAVPSHPSVTAARPKIVRTPSPNDRSNIGSRNSSPSPGPSSHMSTPSPRHAHYETPATSDDEAVSARKAKPVPSPSSSPFGSIF